MKHYDSFPNSMVYVFHLGDGGLADNIKFFMCALELCMITNRRLYYLKTNCPNEKYLQLVYPNMYTSDTSSHMVVTPYICYSTFQYDTLKIPIQDVFTFSKEVFLNSRMLLPTIKPYKSIHLRLGDKYLETDRQYVLCKEDVRVYNEQALFNYIEANLDSTLLFFCDNQQYKTKIKEKYKSIFVLNSKIGHTSLQNTTDEQRLDAITELQILANSTEIICASHSGFSIIASKFKHIPCIQLTN